MVYSQYTMTTPRGFLLLTLFLASPPGCGGGQPSDPITDAAVSTAPVITFACPAGASITSGHVTIQVDGRPRDFFVDLPASTAGPVGVLFSWHGYNQQADAFRTDVGFAPDAVPGHPLIIITPSDTGLQLPVGLGWNITDGTGPAANVDLALFEATLGCLTAEYDIDTTSIYSFGFSAGAVFSNLLHARYPQLITAIASESGAWFNDIAEQMLVNFVVPINWQWPALDPADGGVVLLTHGGPNDVTVLNILDLERAAQTALPFLAAAHRSVVDCPHDAGHALNPALTPVMIETLLTAQHAGTTPAANTPSLQGLPASCTLRSPQ